MARSAPRTERPTVALAAATVTLLAGAAIGAAIGRADVDTPGPIGWGTALALAGLAAVALVTGHRSERHGDPASRVWFVAGFLAGVAAIARVVPLDRIADAADLSTIAGIDGDHLRIAWMVVGAAAVTLAVPAGRSLWRSVDPTVRPRLVRSGLAAAVAVGLSAGIDAVGGPSPAGGLAQVLAGGVVLAVALDVFLVRPTPGLRALSPLPGRGFPNLGDLVEAYRTNG